MDWTTRLPVSPVSEDPWHIASSSNSPKGMAARGAQGALGEGAAILAGPKCALSPHALSLALTHSLTHSLLLDAPLAVRVGLGSDSIIRLFAQSLR